MTTLTPAASEDALFVGDLDAVGRAIAAVVILLILWKAFEQAERRYVRLVHWRIYRARRRWKASDRRHLQTYALTNAARLKLTRARGVGRPCVRPYKPFEVLCEEAFGDFGVICDASQPPHLQQQAMKRLPCWPELLEALYRGEWAVARAAGRKSPHESAEFTLAAAFAISPALVRKTCTEARRNHGRAESPLQATTLAEFAAEREGWRLTQ